MGKSGGQAGCHDTIDVGEEDGDGDDGEDRDEGDGDDGEDRDEGDGEDGNVGNYGDPVQANLTKEQQKQLIAQMLTEVPLIDG